MTIKHSHSSIKAFFNCPLSYYHDRVLKDVPRVQGEAAIWGERVHKDFELRLTEQKPLPKHLAKWEKIVAKFDGRKPQAELKLAIDENLQPTDWDSPTAWFRGILDLYLRVTKTVVASLDWKTGKRRDDFDQLETGALLIFAHEPEVEEVRTGFVWTQSGKMDEEKYLRKNINEMWKNLITRIRRVHRAHETNNWPAKPSGLCNYCGFQPQCPYGRKR